MKGNLLMERWKGKELKPGLMETDLKECGKMINNMVLVSSSAKKLAKKLLKNGEMGNVGHG